MYFAIRFTALLLTLSLPTGVFAQSVYGTIKVALTLKTGQPIPKVLVLVNSLERGDLLRFSGETDDSGFFIFNNVPGGAYSLRMEKSGFKTFEEPTVPVLADSASEINVKLTEGDAAEKQVDDGSAISILKLDRADVATFFNRHEIESLPIYLQNLSFYELLVPGSVRNRAVLPTEQNPQNGIYTSLSGQHFSGTEVVVDGTVNRDPLEGIVVLNPSLDSVSELKITTQNYGAEFGPATGGVVSIQTRSGTNEWHGSAFGYRFTGFGGAGLPNFGESSSLQASSNKRNDFGASLGGAPIHDRLFLFGDYRGIRQAQDGTVLLTVPTGTVKSGCTGSGSGICDLSAYESAYEATLPPDSKCIGTQTCLFNQGLYPNGQIPNDNVSPEMVYFLKLIPWPNHGASNAVTNNFIASGVDSFRNDSFDTRADYVVSSKVRAFTRYSFADFRENGTPAFGTALGGLGTNPSQFAGIMRDRNQGISAGLSWNLSSSLLTDFRFGFFRYHLRMDSPDYGTYPLLNAPKDNQISGLNQLGNLYSSGMPDIQLDNPQLGGLPIAGGLDFLRLGYSTVANTCNCPLREREQQFQFVDNWTKLLGKHNIRWGADFRYLQNYRLNANPRPAGDLEFGDAITGFSLGDFLVGAASDFNRSYLNPTNSSALNAGERQKRVFFYGEDTWRVSSRLTFNYGLRWEIYLPQSVTGANAGGWLQLDSGSKPFLDQFLVAGQAGTNLQGAVKTTFNNFGPRVGFAYQVNSTTVIRAGYARMFDPGYAGTIFGITATQSPPVSVVANVAGLTINSQTGLPFNQPVNVCNSGGCLVPGFNFPTGSFTVKDIFCDNAPSGNLNCTNSSALVQQQADLYAFPRRLRLPTVDGWNIALQEALDRHTYLELSYVGNKGTHVFNDSTGQVQPPFYDLNQATLSGLIGLAANGSCQKPKLIKDFGTTYCKTQDVVRSPFGPVTAHVFYFGNDASSTYNSMQVKVRHQFSSGFSLLANYTWAKVLDFDNLYYRVDPALSYGVGNFDRKHNFVMTNVWDVPIGHGHKVLGDMSAGLNRFVGGWSLAAITSWSSGLPFTPSYRGCGGDVGPDRYRICRPNIVGSVSVTGSRDQYFTTTGGQPLGATCSYPLVGQNPTDTGPCPATVVDPKTGQHVSTPAALEGYYLDSNGGAPLLGATIGPWQRPGAGQIGNVGRNSFRGPGFFQSDLAVAKNIPITERVAVQFRADAFNVFNKVNLANPNTVVDGSSGGQISSIAFGAIQRQMQFSLRVNF